MRSLLVASFVIAIAALTACPTDADPATGDASSDAATPDEGGTSPPFDPKQMAPYDCNYEPAGVYSKDAADACNLLSQDCTNTTLACSLTDQGAQCLPVGDSGCAFPCEHVNDCASGLVCVGAPLACRAICRPGDPCPGNTVCRDVSGRTDVGFCPVPCTVLEPDCPGDDACYLLFGRMECAPTAGPARSKGEPCDFGDECASGLICQDAANPRCLAPCTTDDEYPCAEANEACTALEGLQPLGVCLEAQP